MSSIRSLCGSLLLIGVLHAPLASGADCLAPAVLQPATGMSTVAPEMVRPPAADPYCVLASDALARLRAPPPELASSPSADGYVPLTKDDNTPWRFDMRQNGRQMTAAEFDAWMKAKGIRVATGRAPATTAAAPADAAVSGAAPAATDPAAPVAGDAPPSGTP